MLLKSVEPNYDKYNQDLMTDFDVASASVTVTVLASGKPFELYKSSVPLPAAVMMALKEYEFRPATLIPHGRTDIEVGAYQVTLNVPIRRSRNPGRESESAILVGPGVAKGLLIKQVRPELSELVRRSRIRGTITLEAVIGKQGEAESLRPTGGPFALIEAAYDAVRQWQWRPYLLNNEPVEWMTEIQVRFD